MKKIFTIVLASACLWGCVQKSEIDDLQKQIDDLKAGEIATMSAQIAGIQTSLGDLQRVDTELRGLIETLQEDLSAIDGGDDGKYEEVQRELASLASADEALGQRISDLKNYCDQQDNGVRDWVSLTFTTLEQHSAVLSEIAAIKIRLGQLESALTGLNTTISQKISDAEARVASAIEASETSVKGWVNEQLSGYYTIAQTDAKLKLLEDAYKAADETLAGDITTLRTDLTTAVTNLTSAYQTAISDAITANNGVINAKIASDIQAATTALQTQIDAITTRITNLESRVSALEASVAELIGMIQSIVVIPDYSDGSVKMTDRDENVIRFEIYPLAAAQRLAETGTSVFSLDYVETETKTSIFTNIPITAVSFDGEVIALVVDSSSFPDNVEDGSQSVNARLRISDGTITKSSEFFQLSYMLKPSITGEYSNLGESSVKLYGQCNISDVSGAPITFGIEYSSTDFDTESIKLESSGRDLDNMYYCQVTGLASNTLYYYRSYAIYNGEHMYGRAKSFTTKDPSVSITTRNVTEVTMFNATLNGHIEVDSIDDLNKSVWFLYSDTAVDFDSLKQNGIRVESSLSLDGCSFSYNLGNLHSNANYYFMACAEVNDMEYYGDILSFTTKDFSEAITTLPAVGIGTRWATLKGNLSIYDIEGITTSVGFLISDTATDVESLKVNGVKISSSLLHVDGSIDGAFRSNYGGLQNNTTYYYVAIVEIDNYIYNGDVLSFTTSVYSPAENYNVTTISSVNDVMNGEAGAPYMVTGVVTKLITELNGNHYGNMYINDGTADDLGLYIYGSRDKEGNRISSATPYDCFNDEHENSWEISVGDKVTLVGPLTFYKNQPEIVDATIISIESRAVDLGLSVKWAKCNLCEDGFVSSPEEFGDYYAWGELEAKDNFSWETYKFGSGESELLSKYNTRSSYGAVDNKTVLETGPNGDDVASKILGGKWRIPTDEEWTELRTNCTWTWTSNYNNTGVAGSIVKSNVSGYTNKSIFLPAAGRRYETDLINAGSYGEYWSSSLDTAEPVGAWRVYSCSDGVGRGGIGRVLGQSVRPVTE